MKTIFLSISGREVEVADLTADPLNPPTIRAMTAAGVADAIETLSAGDNDVTLFASSDFDYPEDVGLDASWVSEILSKTGLGKRRVGRI